MTPTEQDKELDLFSEEALNIADSLRSKYPNTWGLLYNNHAMPEVIEFITTDRERVELEARIDELKHLIVDGGIWYQDMTRQFPQKITLNERIKELEA